MLYWRLTFIEPMFKVDSSASLKIYLIRTHTHTRTRTHSRVQWQILLTNAANVSGRLDQYLQRWHLDDSEEATESSELEYHQGHDLMQRPEHRGCARVRVRVREHR